MGEAKYIYFTCYHRRRFLKMAGSLRHTCRLAGRDISVVFGGESNSMKAYLQQRRFQGNDWLSTIKSLPSKYHPYRSLALSTSRVVIQLSKLEKDRLYSTSPLPSSSESSLKKENSVESLHDTSTSSPPEIPATTTPLDSSEPETSSRETPGDVASDAAPLTRAARLKRAVAEYGVVVPVFHVSLALTSLGLLYALVSAGVDFDWLFSRFGVESNRLATGVSTFALAYAVHKLFAPLRIGITLSVAPLLVKWMRAHVTPVAVRWVGGLKALIKRPKP